MSSITIKIQENKLKIYNENKKIITNLNQGCVYKKNTIKIKDHWSGIQSEDSLSTLGLLFAACNFITEDHQHQE